MADSENMLAEPLNAIDDPQERHASLSNSAQILSPRDQLTHRTAIVNFDDLPVDVVCNIALDLKIEDILSMTGVSKKCRAIWTDASVATRLCLHFFPALKPPFEFSTFLEAGKKYFSRRSGKCYTRMSMSLPFTPHNMPDDFIPQSLSGWLRDSKRIFHPDPVVHPTGVYPLGWLGMDKAEFGCFGGGNLVWFALPGYLVIDNIRSLTRKIVSLPNDIMPGRMVSSSKILTVIHDMGENQL